MAKPAVLREVMITLRMAPEMEIEACEKASAVAESMQMSKDKIDEVKMAVIEACLNACEHSNAERREVDMIFSVLGRDEPESLQITVRDGGVGFDSRSGGRRRGGGDAEAKGLHKRGWGLQIIEGLMDDVAIESGAKGTTVTMVKAR